ncbi:hypothetical protein [Desulfomarina sp.]
MKKQYKSLCSSLAHACRGWTVKERDTGETVVRGRFLFHSSSTGFAGHFPGHPILPAVMQLGMVRFLAEKSLGRRLKPQTYSRTKFCGMIVPGQQVEAEVVLREHEEAGWHGKFSLESEAGVIASGQCVLVQIETRGDEQD